MSKFHAHFAEEDERIPSFDCSINEENRPHMDHTLLEFRLAQGVEIPDTTRGFGGAAGGANR
jgi:hypothetical protein